MIFKPNPHKDDKWSVSWIVYEIRSWILVILLILGIKSTFVDHNAIPSGSLLPTIAIGDKVIVSKMSYGLKLPLSEYFAYWNKLYFQVEGKAKDKFKPYYIFGDGMPERGDIVVFDYPRNISDNYIKRVIALPGDTIKIQGTEVILNGKNLSKKIVAVDENLKDIVNFYQYRSFLNKS